MKNFIAFLSALSVVGLVSVWADRPANTYAFQRDTLISSAQVLLLNTTPIEVVPAPGSGFYLEFIRAEIFLDYGGIAYVAAAGEDFHIKYTNGSGITIGTVLDGDTFEATADTLVISTQRSVDAPGTGQSVPVENAALVAYIDPANWDTGNSPLKIRVFYRVVSKAELEAIS